MSNSSTRSNPIKRLFRPLALGAVAILLGACGGIEAGDYWVYRVGETAAVWTDGCYYPETSPPQNLVSDSTTVLNSLTVVVYHTGDSSRVFDNGQISLMGTEADGNFAFIGRSDDATFLGDDGEGAVLVATTMHTVNMAIDGRTVTGSTSELVTTRCEFLTPTPAGEFCPNPPVPECQRDTQWFGVQLDDVRLSEHLDEPEAD
jgi:hypothetical protein